VLPRNAPPVLKLFHELAVGVQDAYAAVGATPSKPELSDTTGLHSTVAELSPLEVEGKRVLWEFMEHLDFVSNLKVTYVLKSSLFTLHTIYYRIFLSIFGSHTGSSLL
jgi:hypothetical protein